MKNKDIQDIRIDVVKMLIDVCKDEPKRMYEVAESYLTQLECSLDEHKKFYQEEYRCN